MTDLYVINFDIKLKYITCNITNSEIYGHLILTPHYNDMIV
jgi:hypothetical protein